MLNVLIRFILIYFITIVSMKLMGKRQVGEMQRSELVTTFFLSELATYPITDNRIPIVYGVIPILSLISIEVIISFLAIKLPFAKMMFNTKPSILINRGRVVEKELFENRITIDELFSMLRLKEYPDITQVYYAFLEPNGQLSVVPFAAEEALRCKNMNCSVKETGYSIAVIQDGVINKKGLSSAGKDEKWLKNELKKRRISSEKRVFLFTVDEDGKITIVFKEGK